MLVWFHAYDRTNYARHFTYAWATLKDLAETKPTIYQEFSNGNFAVKRCKGNFNMLPPDQVIEQTINKEQKGPGGITGITTSLGSIQRWIFSSHVIAAINYDFKESLNIDQQQSSSPKDIGTSRKKYDEEKVTMCCETFTNWNNPFSQSDKLVSITSGIEPKEQVAEDLLKAYNVGLGCLKTFVEERIKTNEKDINETIKKNKLLTFDESLKKVVSKEKGVYLALRSDRETFARMLIVQKKP